MVVKNTTLSDTNAGMPTLRPGTCFNHKYFDTFEMTISRRPINNPAIYQFLCDFYS